MYKYKYKYIYIRNCVTYFFIFSTNGTSPIYTGHLWSAHLKFPRCPPLITPLSAPPPPPARGDTTLRVSWRLSRKWRGKNQLLLPIRISKPSNYVGRASSNPQVPGHHLSHGCPSRPSPRARTQSGHRGTQLASLVPSWTFQAAASTLQCYPV